MFLLEELFIAFKSRGRGKDRKTGEKKRFSIYWFTFQMAVAARNTRPKPGASFASPAGVTGTETLRPLSAAVTVSLAGN